MEEVSTLFVLKEDQLLIVEGRRDRKTSLRLTPRTAGVLRVVGNPEGVFATWDTRDGSLGIAVDHSIRKLVSVELYLERP